MDVFITGATGYMGGRLSAALLGRGHRIRALVRRGSERKLPQGAEPVVGDALDATTYAAQVAPADTFVQLVGVAHPSPAKAEQFRKIDLPSGLAAVQACKQAGVKHLVYVSVAHPAPAMKAYVAVRSQVEEAIREGGLNSTILRPWYVLGPGHWWPYALVPIYRLCELIPSTREGALRLGLVTLQQMVAALVNAVESPVQGVRIVDVPAIRAASQEPEARPSTAGLQIR